MANGGTVRRAPRYSAPEKGRDPVQVYVRDNALWLIPMFKANGYPSAAPALRVVSHLFAGNWPNSDGYTAWQSQFAWYN